MRRTAWGWRLLAILGTATGFGMFYRYYIPQGDDLRFTAQRYHPFGAFTAHLWFHFLRTDYLHISGRTATAVGMLLLRPGVRVFRVLAVAICVWLALACAAWLRPRAGAVGRRTAVVAGASVLPLTLLLAPRLNGDVMAWCMSFANYVLPLACYLTVAVAFLRLVQPADGRSGRRAVGWPLTILGPLLALLTPSLHENMATGMVVLCALVVLLGRRRLGVLGWVMVALGLAGSAEMLSAPGLWERVGYSNGPVPSGETGLLLRLHRIGMGCATTLQLSWLPLAIAAVALLVALPRASRGRATMLALQSLLVVGLAGALALWRVWAAEVVPLHGFQYRLTHNGARVLLGFLGACTLLVVALVAASWTLRPVVGVRPLMVVLMGFGCGGAAIISGVSTPRAYASMALCLMLAAFTTVLDGLPRAAVHPTVDRADADGADDADTGADGAGTSEADDAQASGVTTGRPDAVARAGVFGPAPARSRVVAALVCLACVGGSISWLVVSQRAMRGNWAAWRPVAEMFAAANTSGRPVSVQVPRFLPHPDYQFDHGFDLDIYYKSMATWYALPNGSRLVQLP